MIRRLTALLAFVAIANPLCCCLAAAQVDKDGESSQAIHACCETSPKDTLPGDQDSNCACDGESLTATAAEFPLVIAESSWQWRGADDFTGGIAQLTAPPLPSRDAASTLGNLPGRTPLLRTPQALCVFLI